MSMFEELQDILIRGKIKGLSEEEILDEFYKGTVCKFYCSVETPSRIYEDMNKNGVSISEAIRHELTNILEQDKDKYLPQHRAVIEENIKKPTHKSKLIGRIEARVRYDGGEWNKKNIKTLGYTVHDKDFSDQLNNHLKKTKQKKSDFVRKWILYGVDYEYKTLCVEAKNE